MKRTRLSVCRRKARFIAMEDALIVAGRAEYPLRPYRCDRCFHYHLTSRTKGKKVPQFVLEKLRHDKVGADKVGADRPGQAPS